MRSGAPWRVLSACHAPRTTYHNRCGRCRKAGAWDGMMDAITAAHNGEGLPIRLRLPLDGRMIVLADKA
ncbi:hypothetical protein CG471_08640 [Sphingobium sp. IP1]|nr:hypothetical protein CG471_08640 [Sphingobium sp. IP1]